MQPCPECGNPDRTKEPGEYALLQLTQGRLKLDVDSRSNTAVVVKVTICGNCGHVTLHESR